MSIRPVDEGSEVAGSGPAPDLVAAPGTYLDPASLPVPFCPGCGHGTILERLDAALVELSPDPGKVVIVSDIGCSGLSDKFFTTNAFHGLHGRSVTYASGIKLANPDLHVVVLIGDGGCGIGGHHLINAARRNIGLTVIVFNNLNYGMTGGEHSVSTPTGAVTSTTPHGQLEQPMDICRTVEVNGASFVARTTTFESDVTSLMLRALRNDGFSLVDVWELCAAYFAPANRLSRKGMHELIGGLGFSTGVVHELTRPEYSRSYREQHAGSSPGATRLGSRPIETRYRSEVSRHLGWIVAGAAGKHIISAAGALARGGVRSGLWASQRNDYPVTVRTGYSLSEVILSPEEILFTGIPSPDIVLDLFPEGHARVASQIRTATSGAVIYRAPDLPEVETAARVVELDFGRAPGWGRKKDAWALMAVAAALRDTGAYPVDALRDALAAHPDRQAAIDAGLSL